VRVAITGASGFVATWLWKELARAGHEVSGIDRVATDPHITTGNLLDVDVVRDWLVRSNPHVVYHLAAQVGRIFGEQDVSHTVRSNAEMTANLARWCGELGIRLAYVSSSEVYGDLGDRPALEYGPKALPHNLYGLSKRWGEEACQLYAPDGLVIARLSMPYGPGVPPGRGRRAMDTFLWQAHHRMPLTVHRGAERSWCWVGDTVAGLRMVIEQPAPGVWNIGRDDDPRSMLDIARMACDMAGAPHDLIREVDPPQRQTVVKRLDTGSIRLLGWRPLVDLESGMAAVYEHVKQYGPDL